MKSLLAKAASAAKSTFSDAKNVAGQAVAKVTGTANAVATAAKAAATNVASKAAAAITAVQAVTKAAVAKTVGSAQQVAAKSANAAKDAAIATANALKAAAAKAKDMGNKAVGSPIVQCPLQLRKTAATKVNTEIKDFLRSRGENPELLVNDSYTLYEAITTASRLKDLRVFRTANNGLRTSGMKAAFDGTKGMVGNTTATAIFKRAFEDGIKSGTGSIILGLGKTGAIASVMSMAEEGIKQWKNKKFDASRLAATGGTGFLKGIVTGVAYAGAVAGTVAIAAAASMTAPVWIPVAAGVTASVALGIALDEADKKYEITNKLASEISNTGRKVREFKPKMLRAPP